jgi:hypothetical protein
MRTSRWLLTRVAPVAAIGSAFLWAAVNVAAQQTDGEKKEDVIVIRRGVAAGGGMGAPGVAMPMQGMPGRGKVDVVFEADAAGVAMPMQGMPGMPGMPGMGGPVGVFNFITSEASFHGPPTKGSPFSAQTVTEHTQTLADGNRIVRKSETALYRDSEGRTRREQELQRIGPWSSSGENQQLIFISDPVAEVSYMLNTADKIAQKIPARGLFMRRESVDGAQKEETVIIEGGPGPGHRRGPGPGPGHPQGPGPHVRMLPAAPAGMAVRGAFHPGGQDVKTESLGAQVINGVSAEGTRVVLTIPAGEIGNERPIESVTETWHSSELNMVVKSSHTDPRMGTTVFEMRNIIRAEPSPTLFQVPSDYTVKEPGEGGPMRLRIPAGGQ